MIRSTIADQIAAYLREELRTGRIADKLPSIRKLASDLDTSKASVMAALRLLETDGVISPSGKREPRRIVSHSQLSQKSRSLRIGILLDDPLEEEDPSDIQELMHLARSLERSGHVCVFPPKSQSELRHNLQQIIQMVRPISVDAWIVWGKTRPVLQWFSEQTTPCFSYTGPFSGLPMAGAANATYEAMAHAVRHLTTLGHRRIVKIDQLNSSQNLTVERFVQGLAEAGITANEYHLPAWENTPDGLQTLLESLFHLTPPTALVVTEANHLQGIYSFLNRRGLQVPRDISLVLIFNAPSSEWCRPAIAHFALETRPITKSALRWVGSIAMGRPHTKQDFFDAKFVPGGSIAPPRGR